MVRRQYWRLNSQLARGSLQRMKVAGIIINYCTPELTLEATSSLVRELRQVGSFHVFVIDNASPDGSYSKLQEAAKGTDWERDVTIVLSPKNGGYGYGINLGARLAAALPDAPEYLYALNSDATVDAQSLRSLIAGLDNNPRVAVTGGRVEATTGELQAAAFRFPTLLSELEGNARLGVISSLLKSYRVYLEEPSADTRVDWLPGTSMLMRRSVFEEVGGFDDDFFLYFEEVDFCKRVQNAGYDVQFVAHSVVKHVGAASTKLDPMRRLPTYWYDSRHRYFIKHHGRAYAAGADAAAIVGHAVCTLYTRLLPRDDRSPPRDGAFLDLLTSSVKHVLRAK